MTAGAPISVQGHEKEQQETMLEAINSRAGGQGRKSAQILKPQSATDLISWKSFGPS
jgi:hypothetical protein